MKIKKCEDAALLARLNQSVHELHHQAYPDIFKPFDYLETLDLFQKLMQESNHYLLVIEAEQQVVGYMWGQIISLSETPFRYSQKTFYIHQLSIEPHYQRKGYGHALMTYVEDLAKQASCDTVELDYWVKNQQAKTFYEKEFYEPMRRYCRKRL